MSVKGFVSMVPRVKRSVFKGKEMVRVAAWFGQGGRVLSEGNHKGVKIWRVRID